MGKNPFLFFVIRLTAFLTAVAVGMLLGMAVGMLAGMLAETLAGCAVMVVVASTGIVWLSIYMMGKVVGGCGGCVWVGMSSSLMRKNNPQGRRCSPSRTRGKKRKGDEMTVEDLAGEELSFEGMFAIGREDDADVRVTHKGVSRQHALIYPMDGAWWVRDRGSLNGTVVVRGKGGETSRVPALKNPISLRPGDRIHLGGLEVLTVVSC